MPILSLCGSGSSGTKSY